MGVSYADVLDGPAGQQSAFSSSGAVLLLLLESLHHVSSPQSSLFLELLLENEKNFEEIL